MRKTPQRLFSGIIVCGVCIGGLGCSPGFYQHDADAQVYKILRDRKYDTVGYQPQVVAGAGPVAGVFDVPSALEQKLPTLRDQGRGVVPAPGTSALPSRAYEPIPVTPLPPIEPVALELPPDIQSYGPLGPWPDGPIEHDVPRDMPPLPGAPGHSPAQSEMSGPREGYATPPGLPRPLTGPVGVMPPVRTATAMPLESDDHLPQVQSLEERAVFGAPSERLAYGPPAPASKPLSLGLFDSLQFGVEHSRTYRSQMDDVYLAALDVTLQRHLFEPNAFAKVGLNYTGGQRDTDYKSAMAATVDAGVKQRLPYGGQIMAEALVSFVRALSSNASDGESAQAVLSGSLPLLRGAGLVNLEPLVSSERQMIYHIRAFEDFRRQYAVNVATQYFQVLIALQSVNNRRENVANLSGLLERTRALYSQAPIGLKGRLGFLEVQRAEQSLLSGQDDLISAQASYLNTLDNFKLLIGMDIRQDLQVVPVALQVHVPEIEQRDVVNLAVKYRLDLQTARDQVDDARRQVALTQNGLLPDLNLTAQGQLGNRVDTPAHSLDSRDLTYSAGITLDLPVDRLAERNNYRAALIAFNAAQRVYGSLRDEIAADVRTAVRAIRQAQSSVAIQRRSIELAQKRLENANILLKLGTINARDFVEAQQSLLSAQDAFEQAQANLQVQILQFLRLTGTLRVDPAAGTLGRAMDRAQRKPVTPVSLGPQAPSQAS